MRLWKHRLLAKMLVALASLVAGVYVFAAADDARDAPRAEGIWQGSLELAGQRLRLVVHMRRGPGDVLVGTLDSLDQRVVGLPLGAISLTEDVLSFQVSQIGARYAGNFNGDDTIRGVWSQGPNAISLILRRTANHE